MTDNLVMILMTHTLVMMFMMQTYQKCCPLTLASASLSATIKGDVDGDDDLGDENEDVDVDDNYDDAFEYLCCCVHACITV